MTEITIIIVFCAKCLTKLYVFVLERKYLLYIYVHKKYIKSTFQIKKFKLQSDFKTPNFFIKKNLVKYVNITTFYPIEILN